MLVAIGATVVGAHLVHRLGAAAGPISLAGGITLMCGLLIGFGTLATLMFENIYLFIGDAGVVLHVNGAETEIAWSDLGDVVAHPSGELVLARASADAVRWDAGRAAAPIAAQIEEARRKANLGLPVRLSGPPRAF